jgi:ribosomal protein L11 methyltransferase
VVSNILAQPLILLAPLLAARGPRLALSGILDEQAEEVMRAYRPWFEMELAGGEDHWVLIEGRRR